MLLHDCEVRGLTGEQLLVPLGYLFGALHND